MHEHTVIGWDIGGAHVKACLLQDGEVLDVAEWPCPLWLGMDRLQGILQTAHRRWPGMDAAQHAVTMTGEMVDLFTDRQDGVRQIAAVLTGALACGPGDAHFFAGDSGWYRGDDVAGHWEAVASANWIATARHAALCVGAGLLVDIGSTTTDLIPFRNGRLLGASRTDAQRLASGELVYHGVVRTPLCAVAQRIEWRGQPHNVMNEFFATSADVYRLTGELDPAHDLHPSADNAAKDAEATRQRLARMIGLDRHDGCAEDWLDFSRAWRTLQVRVLGAELRRVLEAHGLARDAVIVSAGCGDFLVRDVVAAAGTDGWRPQRIVAYGRDIAPVGLRAGTEVQAWAQVCAPCVAVATLFDMERSACGSSRSAAA